MTNTAEQSWETNAWKLRGAGRYEAARVGGKAARSNMAGLRRAWLRFAKAVVRRGLTPRAGFLKHNTHWGLSLEVLIVEPCPLSKTAEGTWAQVVGRCALRPHRDRGRMEAHVEATCTTYVASTARGLLTRILKVDEEARKKAREKVISEWGPAEHEAAAMLAPILGKEGAGSAWSGRVTEDNKVLVVLSHRASCLDQAKVKLKKAGWVRQINGTSVVTLGNSADVWVPQEDISHVESL